MCDKSPLGIADREQTEPKRARRLDKLQTRLDRCRIADESHRRIQMQQLPEPESFAYLSRLRLGRTDEHYSIVGADQASKKRSSQVAARTDGDAQTVRDPKQRRSDAAVQQNIRGARVGRMERRTFTQPYQTIDVRSGDISVSLVAVGGRYGEKFLQAVVVDLESQQTGSRAGDGSALFVGAIGYDSHGARPGRMRGFFATASRMRSAVIEVLSASLR